MADSDDAAVTTQWRRAAKFYRRPLGVPWLIGLVVIPLLLGTIGYGLLERTASQTTGPAGNLPTLAPPTSAGASPSSPTIPPISLAPVSITRNGKDITLRGDFPDAKAKAALLDAVTASVGAEGNVIDNLGINPDVNALDFSDAGPVFNAAASIPNFSLTVSGDTITLAGTAATMDQADAVLQAADDAWPNLNIDNQIAVSGPVTPTGSPAPAPVPGGPGNACANLGADVKALGPITFGTDGVTLTPASEQTLMQVVDKLKACPSANVTVNGYTDNTGNDAINIPLSDRRANTVVDFLVAHGVARDHVTEKGHGAADPVADNATPDGQAKNRRVEITVS
jgi:peptidoglycan-binding protein ArfA